MDCRISTPFWSPSFATMRGHPYFTSIGIFGGVFQNPSDTYATRLFWMSWVPLYLDVLKKDFNLTLYCSTLAMDPDQQRTTVNVTYVDQETGEALQQINHLFAPTAAYTMGNDPGGWADTLSFNRYTGQVELPTWQWLPAQNNTSLQVFISISAATISDELREELSGSPGDRLVLFFRQPHGYMIAASHGKYWSNSDEDFRSVIPLAHPPNISAYRLWNCTRSTDGLIQQACVQLYAAYQSWPAIPALRQNTVLGGQQYWLATGFSTGSLRVTVLMLKNRASVMSGIDTSNARVDERVADRKGITFVILAVVSTLAICLPLLVGFWLAAWLGKLAVKMDCIAQLRFSTTSAEPTVFRELHRFQGSFTQMERGLQAFGKFVPQAVVKVLIAGQMTINERMQPETLTVMIADIEGFSTMCETVSPTVLVEVCTEYFEAMCSVFGVLALTLTGARWVVTPPTMSQTSLVAVPGCSYRVSYTCLGDGVNLSARLEALNKKFGTYLCVSHATYAGCRDDFHFRRLAQVTVPGKAEVVPVYEVLCAATRGELHKARVDVERHCLAPPRHIADLDDAKPCIPQHRPAALPRQCRGLRPGAERWRGGGPPQPGWVVYHWGHVDGDSLLQYAQHYEQAYQALVGCSSPAEARALLATKALLDVPDPAWAALGRQLEGVEAGRPWDGIVHFTEK